VGNQSAEVDVDGCIEVVEIIPEELDAEVRNIRVRAQDWRFYQLEGGNYQL
jgi:hypothetical protein